MSAATIEETRPGGAGGSDKPKLAVFKFASCDGCQLSLLDAEDELLAVAWQRQNDPRRGEMEMTVNVSNEQAFRLMSRNFARWLLKQLDEAKSR